MVQIEKVCYNKNSSFKYFIEAAYEMLYYKKIQCAVSKNAFEKNDLGTGIYRRKEVYYGKCNYYGSPIDQA